MTRSSAPASQCLTSEGRRPHDKESSVNYYKPFPARIQRGQRFGDNPGWGPNPPGGHNGDDYLSQVGEPVYAAGDGVVVFAGRFDSTYADNWGWNLNFGGQMVVLNLDGTDGPYVEYGHNSELRVKTGDRVTGGQVIALSGEDDGGTHVITGPHLHVGCLPPNFDLNTNTYGRVNPDLYLTDYPDEAAAISVQSTNTTPVQEDEMPSLDEIARAVWSYRNTDIEQRDAYQVLRDTPGAVWKQPIDWRDPATGELKRGATTAETQLSFLDTNTARIIDSSRAAADIAQQINAAGLAAQVRDELVKLIGGAK